MITQVADALQFAHDSGIIHRDLKPQNVLLDGRGNAKITDFDLARVVDGTLGTRTGALGAFLFSAPEALMNAATADERSDVYSLAMTALYLLRGQELPMDVVRDPSDVIAELQCPEAIKQALVVGLEWDRSRRTASAAEFRRSVIDGVFDHRKTSRVAIPGDFQLSGIDATEATFRFATRLTARERFAIDAVVRAVSPDACEVVYFQQEAMGAVVRLVATDRAHIDEIVSVLMGLGSSAGHARKSSSVTDLVRAHPAGPHGLTQSGVMEAVQHLGAHLTSVVCRSPDGRVDRIVQRDEPSGPADRVPIAAESAPGPGRVVNRPGSLLGPSGDS